VNIPDINCKTSFFLGKYLVKQKDEKIYSFI